MGVCAQTMCPGSCSTTLTSDFPKWSQEASVTLRSRDAMLALRTPGARLRSEHLATPRGYLKHLANPGSSSSTLRLLSLLPPVAFELGADLVAGLESLQATDDEWRVGQWVVGMELFIAVSAMSLRNQMYHVRSTFTFR